MDRSTETIDRGGTDDDTIRLDRRRRHLRPDRHRCCGSGQLPGRDPAPERLAARGHRSGSATHALCGLDPHGSSSSDRRSHGRELHARPADSRTLGDRARVRKEERATVRVRWRHWRRLRVRRNDRCANRRLPTHAGRAAVHQRQRLDERRRLLHGVPATLVLPAAARRPWSAPGGQPRCRRFHSPATTCTQPASTT